MCRRGPRLWACEQEGGVGNGKGRSPEQATRVRTACFEDVNPVQRAAVQP